MAPRSMQAGSLAVQDYQMQCAIYGVLAVEQLVPRTTIRDSRHMGLAEVEMIIEKVEWHQLSLAALYCEHRQHALLIRSGR